jgi:hypothetical protein
LWFVDHSSASEDKLVLKFASKLNEIRANLDFDVISEVDMPDELTDEYVISFNELGGAGPQMTFSSKHLKVDAGSLSVTAAGAGAGFSAETGECIKSVDSSSDGVHFLDEFESVTCSN